MCFSGGEIVLISIASLCGGTGKSTVGLNLASLLGESVCFLRTNAVLKENFKSDLEFPILRGDLGEIWQQVIDEKLVDNYYVLVELDAKAEWERDVLLKSDLILLIMTPTVEHLRGIQEIIELLFRYNYPKERIKVVCNRYKLKRGLEGDEILAVLPIPLARWQWLPEEPLLLEAEKKGELLSLLQPKNRFVSLVRRLALEIVELEPLKVSNDNDDINTQNLYPLRFEAHRMLVERVVLDPSLPEKELKLELLEEIGSILNELRSLGRKFSKKEEEILRQKLLDDVLGLGEIEELVRDHTITEIMVNGANQIYVERNGLLELTDRKFFSNDEVKRIIERIVSPLGRRIDESSPAVDARLPDGSRVHAIIPPLSLNGPTLTIRKFSKGLLEAEDLIKNQSITEEMLGFLKEAVIKRQNIIISGGTGSGKTTLLNIISGFIPPKERIVCIEDAAELNLKQEHVVRLEARPSNIEGKGQVSIRDLVRHALRMRPDRIVVGEVRGAEALDMLQAMNTGHSGSLTTAHANTPEDLVLRLETMVLMSGFDLPIKAIREQIVAAIDLIVQTVREADGKRRITSIKKVSRIKDGQILLKSVF